MASLSAARVKAIKKPGMHGDGNGLYLRVTGSGSRSWMQRIVIHGRRRDMGLGSYPAIGLAEARALALANKALVTAGRILWPNATGPTSRAFGKLRRRSMTQTCPAGATASTQ